MPPEIEKHKVKGAPLPGVAELSLLDVAIPTVSRGQPAVENQIELWDKDSQTAKNFELAKGTVARLETVPLTSEQQVQFGLKTQEEAKKSGDEKNAQLATGFFITPDGWMVTNSHVAMFGSLTAHLADGRDRPTQTYYLDAAKDIAIVKVLPKSIEETFPFLKIRFSKRLKRGEELTTVGHTNGWTKPHCSQGFYQHTLRRDVIAPNIEATYLLSQTDSKMKVYENRTHIEGGNSGSPAIDSKGHAVGVIFGKKTDEISKVPYVGLVLRGTELKEAIEHIPALQGRFERSGELRRNRYYF